ncbi:hypothetical protein [Streptomyces cylindrosporus]|uniref:hypothetical protein n=1 Tax=Streptomyces cylindrosporus TaxID=2927583 RepID=UPI0027E2DF67|nr:hypothetical protein [Streptomyces cylindrosporus]
MQQSPYASLGPRWSVRRSCSLGLAILLISHDLGVVRELCDRVAVMRAGRFVEEGPAGQVLVAPGHPYTRELRDAAPKLTVRQP